MLRRSSAGRGRREAGAGPAAGRGKADDTYMTSGTAQCGPSATNSTRASRRGGITSNTVRTQRQRSSPASGEPGRREAPTEPRFWGLPAAPPARGPWDTPAPTPRGRLGGPGSASAAAYPGRERRPGGGRGRDVCSWLVLAAEVLRERSLRSCCPPLLLSLAGSCRGIP